MARILVHLTFGPEASTRAALAFLVARSAIADGHEVSMFLAGDAVQLLRPPTIDAVVAGGGTVYASGMSSKARGLASEDAGLPVQMATPNQLVALALEHDRVFTY